MYQGNNPSALRSMQWICDALLHLLKTEKYERITIKCICEYADLSRQTFYQMFASKEEVIYYHFSKLFQKFARECDPFRDITILQLARSFFSFFYEQRDFIQILISNNLTFLLVQQFEVYLREIALFRGISDKEPHGDYTAAYVAGALTQILIHWFEQSFDLNIEELSKLTESIIRGKPFASSKEQIHFRNLYQ